MNTDYQDIKSYKNEKSVEICENLCPNLIKTVYKFKKYFGFIFLCF
jgi:hypothetical protein